MKSVVLIVILAFAVFAGCTSQAEETANSAAERVESSPKIECPNGIEDDPYPGACGLYTDEDLNNICDWSE